MNQSPIHSLSISFPAAISLAALLTSSLAFGAQEPLPSPYEPAISFEEANARAALPRWLSLAYEEFDTRTGEPGVPSQMRMRELAPDERGYFLVQLDGPITEAMKAGVNATGAELLDYVPNYTFLARASSAQIARARRAAHVVWTGAWHPAYRIEPRLAALARDPSTMHVEGRIVAVVFPGVTTAGVQAELEALGGVIESRDDLTGRSVLTLRATPAAVLAMAHVMNVQWLEIAPSNAPRNNTTKWVIQTFVNNDTRIWNLGLLGAGQVIGHIDGGISTTSCYFADPAGNPIGPLHRKIVFNSGAAVDSHGTHTAGTSLGDSFPV
ncbi:MAG: hypothetical protein ABI054_13225, partial [Planctomycetota bacterium]